MRRIPIQTPVLVAVMLLSLALQATADPGRGFAESLINLSHLDHLYFDRNRDGEWVGMVGIYAEAPDYGLVGDEDEGFACVDDCARALQVYLRHHELTGSGRSWRRAVQLTRFLLGMEDDDGRFFNFVWKDMTVNRDGPTSRPEIGWWSARAIRALGEIHSRLVATAPLLAMRISGVMWRAARGLQRGPILDEQLEGTGSTRLPRRSLVIAAIYLDGFTRYLRHGRDENVRRVARGLARSLLASTRLNRMAEPAGAIRPMSGSRIWHGWGSHVGEGLVAGFDLTGDEAFLAEARRIAIEFDAFRLAAGLPGLYRPAIDHSEQIAYGISTRVSYLAALYRRGGEPFLAGLAGLHASWLFGNNRADEAVYDRDTGRCFDGVTRGIVNRNSGAESTIEALLALLDLASIRESHSWLSARRVEFAAGTGESKPGILATFEKSDGSRWDLTADPADGSCSLTPRAPRY